MRISAVMVLTVILGIMLAVMGHSIWHQPMLTVMNMVTGFFSGGHVVA